MKKMMNKNRILIVFLLMGSIFSLHAADKVTIKLASLFPIGSSWDTTLREIASEIKKNTGGDVSMKIYSGGTMGSEGNVLRKIKIGQIDAGVFSAFGLKEMVSDTFVISFPFLLQSENEVDFALRFYTPEFKREFNKKGFEPLVWSKSGWAHIFSNKPVKTPEDLKKLKLGFSPNETEMIDAFRNMGFNVIPIDMTGMTMALQTGMIEAFYSPPALAASYQWFGLANYMMEMPIAPVVGSIIISKRTWNRIPKKHRPAVRTAIKKAEKRFYLQTDSMTREAIEIMKKNGLHVVKLTESQKNVWRNIVLLTDYSDFTTGKGSVSAKTYNDFKSKVEDYRN